MKRALVLCLILIAVGLIGSLGNPTTRSFGVHERTQEGDAGTTTDTVVGEVPAAFPADASLPIDRKGGYLVTRVIDGDTIEIDLDGKVETVRYIGIDTPETVHPTRGAECYGREASDRNKALVAGKLVRLESDVTDRDKYGRLLRYVYVGDLFINRALVEDGYANVYTYPPDVRHNEEFLALERIAREERRGLWGGCGADMISARPVPSSAVPGQCAIKGNINAGGEKIYHTPDCEYYSRTTINESAGERMFCSEEEALKAGWRKALNCAQ